MNRFDQYSADNAFLSDCASRVEKYIEEGDISGCLSQLYRHLFVAREASGFLKALEFAKERHGTQVRKYTGEPYWHHPLEVASVLGRMGPISVSPQMIQAALLHDVVEDTPTTIGEIEEKFGSEVSSLVDWLTDIQYEGIRPNRAARVKANLERFSRASDGAKIIRCADILSNVQSIVAHDQDFAKVYMAEKREYLPVLRDSVPASLFCALENIIEEYFNE